MRGWGWGRWLFLAVAALQVLVVLGFAGSRELVLRRGVEIVLETVPVDPRDLFRGDYVVLRYAVSSNKLCYYGVGRTVYVPLVREAGDVFRQSAGAAATVAEARVLAPEGVFLRGRVTRFDEMGTCEVAYGIESYFVPEGTGREIERLRGQLKVRVAVDGEGRAAIVGLILPTPSPTPAP